ncbi:protein WVD2-like 7 [Rhododendron vialii]|uniref:protein WVD2-like 7 n=1 Tax=Rhododendron vialii TaxID=182163 RepID=UPI00265E1558|nr:protein WVD2-like 7 [Rhododendron vialii]
MGESACLVQPFSYGSGIASGAKQGNPMHALGDSVSFGRFMSESLSWEKWSTFSHKSYVEEAERYAQPGSVAQKKAFFEAHYKSIAAKKAAALLEQANAANNHAQPEFEQQSIDNSMKHSNVVHGNDDNSNAELQKAENGKVKPEFLSSNSAAHQRAPRVPASPAKPAAPIHPGRENNATPLTRNTATHSTDKLKLTPKSTPAKEQDGSTTPAARRMDSSRVASSPNNKSKNSKTPLSTPMKASANGVLVNPSAIPSSESKRPRTQLDISTPGSKTRAPKWHILSAVCSKSFSACRNKLQSPILSSPFSLRTEERAARRKQKLEEKFNANEGQKVQLQTRLKEKAETELRKLRQSLCFRAQPLPDFYNEREAAKDQIKNVKIPLPHPNSPKIGRGKPSSSPSRGITSPPPETASSKKSCSKNFLKKEKSDHKSVLLAP